MWRPSVEPPGKAPALRDQLQRKNLHLWEETSRHFGAKQVGGRSPAIRQVLALAEQVAPTNATVLLTGETGTGKERTRNRAAVLRRRTGSGPTRRDH